MVNLYMRRQGLTSTKLKPPDTDLDNKSKKNVVFYIDVEPITTKEGNLIHIYMDDLPPHQSGETDTSISCMCMIAMAS